MNTPSISNIRADDPFSPFDELLADGHITPEEHRQQCTMLVRDMITDAATGRRRSTRTSLVPDQPPEVHTSVDDPKSLVATLANSMSLTHDLLVVQLMTLDASAPAAACLGVQCDNDLSTPAGTLLNAVANSHLESAAQTLSTLSAAVGGRERRRTDHGVPSSPAPTGDNVIDAEIVAPTIDGAP